MRVSNCDHYAKLLVSLTEHFEGKRESGEFHNSYTILVATTYMAFSSGFYDNNKLSGWYKKRFLLRLTLAVFKDLTPKQFSVMQQGNSLHPLIANQHTTKKSTCEIPIIGLRKFARLSLSSRESG